MPSNLPLRNPVNLPTESLFTGVKIMLLKQGLNTFKGWWLRKSAIWGAVALAFVIGRLSHVEVQIEQLASLNGISAATMASLHDVLTGIIENLGKLLSVALAVIGEALLSRITAKVTEEPIIPVSIPTEE